MPVPDLCNRTQTMGFMSSCLGTLRFPEPPAFWGLRRGSRRPSIPVGSYPQLPAPRCASLILVPRTHPLQADAALLENGSHVQGPRRPHTEPRCAPGVRATQQHLLGQTPFHAPPKLQEKLRTHQSPLPRWIQHPSHRQQGAAQAGRTLGWPNLVPLTLNAQIWRKVTSRTSKFSPWSLRKEGCAEV